MKRTRIIALVLCAAVMLMGAGYAYWQDAITISNTVATGELNVKFTAATLLNVGTDNYAQPSTPVVADKSVTYTLSNLYPGAAAKYTATVLNNGTIPAVVKDYAILDVAGVVTGKTLVTDDQKAFFLVTGTIVRKNKAGVAQQTFTIPANTTLANLQTVLNTFKPRLEPEDTMVFDMDLTLSSAVGDSDKLEHKYVKNTLTINFKQHNE